MPTLVLVSIIGLLTLVVGMLAVITYNLRSFRWIIYQISDDATRSRRESETLFAQIQSLLALERRLQLKMPLPPMRGWAGSPDFLLALAQEALTHEPLITVECSSGVSTVVLARCMQLSGTGHVYSLEHEPEYAAETRDLLRRYELEDWATVLNAPLVTLPDGSKWYSEEGIPANLPPIELLVVDGPPSAIGRLARYPALPRLAHRMALKFAIFVDDAAREDEREMVRLWRQERPSMREIDMKCEKGLVVLRQDCRALSDQEHLSTPGATA